MEAIGSGSQEDIPEDVPEDPDYIDADFTIKKKPLRYRIMKRLDPDEKAKRGKKVLWTISRIDTDWGCGVEYEARKSYVARLPKEAVHITKRKGEWCVVDMDPDWPEYADPDAPKDEDGNWAGPHNYADAFGYFQYFADQRIRKGYEALGKLNVQKKPLDWKQIGIAAVAAVVFLFVVMQFIS